MKFISKIDDFFDLLFPQSCSACGEGLVKGEYVVCSYCLAELPYLNTHIQPYEPLEMKFQGRLTIDFSLAYLKFIKGGSVQNLLHRLKYEGRREVGIFLGQKFGEALQKVGYSQRTDLIVPVPIHPSKLKKRGYNQAEIFARGLSEGMGLPCEAHILKRLKKSRSQTERGKAERLSDIEGAFSVIQQDKIFSKRILLVDDVITTGATVEVCSSALEAAGCKSIGLAAIAAA